MEIVIKKISAADTIKVRQEVLRIGKPEESCWLKGDLLPSTQHFGLILSNSIVGVLSVYEQSINLFDSKHQYQIRGMAVLQAYQNQKFGQQLVLFAENELSKKKSEFIWFNARTSAIGFYEKLGYQTIGAIFPVDLIGNHVVMFKKMQF